MKKSLWLDLMSNFNFAENLDEFERIQKFYGQKHRQYHNGEHISDCLEKAENLAETKENHVLKLAIWYHDIIYQPLKSRNEEKSAIQAKDFLSQRNAADSIIQRVHKLIMATLHKDKPKSLEAAYIMDIDISILGSEAGEYKLYCEKIRKEYKMVPWFLYRKKRIEIMEAFLQREQLYYTKHYKDALEQKARQNIAEELRELKK